MSYTMVTLTGQVLVGAAVPLPGALVSVYLSGEISDGESIFMPLPLKVECDDEGNLPASGDGALTVPANDDVTTTPQGTTYRVTIAQPDGRPLDTWSVSVPAASAPSVSLFSLERVAA